MKQEGGRTRRSPHVKYNNVLQKKMRHAGKLETKWEGPFIAIDTPRPSAFKLKTMEGEDIPHTWNQELLQKYFV